MNKKLVMASSFCLGALMLVTTAFADMTSKSGYDQLKDSIKQTAKAVSGQIPNYTFETVFSIKYNDELVYTESDKNKVDISKQMEETTGSREYANGKLNKIYHYSDKKQSISYQPDNDVYLVTEYEDDRVQPSMKDPFEDERARDVEMIFDAVVGNLKDYVMVEEKPDGTKEFSGSLSEVQIPAIVNAVSSFAYKQTFSGRTAFGTEADDKFHNLVSDISVKTIIGKATVDKSGIMERISGTVSMTGKDKKGTAHEIVLEFSAGILDIGKTVINAPDLTGKKVEKSMGRSYSEKTVPKKYVGEYKNDIVIEKNDSFVKIGERMVKVEHIDDKHVSGIYTETINPEYSEYSSENTQFAFDAEIKGPYQAEFRYKNSAGSEEIGNIHFDTTGKIYFNIPGSRRYNNDSEFTRIFNK